MCLTQPHDPARQILPPLRDDKTKADVGGTGADAKNTEPGSRREETRPTCRRARGTKPGKTWHAW